MLRSFVLILLLVFKCFRLVLARYFMGILFSVTVFLFHRIQLHAFIWEVYLA